MFIDINLRFFILFIITSANAQNPNMISNICNSDDDFSDSQLILTRTATIDGNLERKINIYWFHRKFKIGDTIAVYNTTPTNEEHPIYKFTPLFRNGHLNINLGITILYGSTLFARTQCLNFYATWIRDNKIRKTSCLSTYPTWMHDKRSLLERSKLSELFIPGTHMSGSYMTDLPRRENIVDKFTITQNQDVLSQLIHGTRYLDITPGYYPYLQEQYWANHNNIRMIPLIKIIKDIRLFMESTKEIVIIAFRKFPVGFDNAEEHDKFINYLKYQFSDLYLETENSDGWTMQLNTIWELDKRLIIAYADTNAQIKHNIWSMPWITESKEKSIYKLQRFIEEEEDMAYFFLVSYKPLNHGLRAMLVKIESEIDNDNCNNTCLEQLISHGRSSRNIADKIAPIITSVYNQMDFNVANIVAVNFIDSTGLVEIALKWNERRWSSCIDYHKSQRLNYTTL